MSRFIDLTGKKFGLLTALGRVPQKDCQNRYGVCWFCSCECGTKTTVQAGSLRSGNTKSCGCRNGLGNFRRANGVSGLGSVLRPDSATKTELQRIASALETLVAALSSRSQVSGVCLVQSESSETAFVPKPD